MIVKTKITIPHVRHVLVDRSRLMRLLEEGMRARLTLLIAPAGYGKTTLLSEWAIHGVRPAAWISLDKQDDDWVQFWSYITASIREQIPGFGPSVWPLLEQGPSASVVSTEPAIQAMLNELEQITDELVIILDDVHLIESHVIYKSLSYLLEHLPAHIHLYMASRTELTFPTARLLARGELRRITMQELRFGPEEGFAFFRDTTELSLTRDQVAQLCHQTEGWISGLQLAAISLKGSHNIEESIHRFSGHQQDIAEYLLEEVFRHQTEELRSFLLRTSILSRMNHSLCQAVTGQESSQEQLEKLEQYHLFIIPLDEQQEWYRYHHLWSEFLHKMFYRQSEVEWEKAHVHAASWLESHGFLEEAAEHYLTGRQFQEVVRIMEEHLYTFLYKKSVVLSRWILQVPERYLVHRPYLEWFYLNLMFVDRRQWKYIPEKVEQAKTRYEALKGQMEENEWKTFMGDLYLLHAMSFFIQKDLKHSADYLIKADQYMMHNSISHLIGQNKHFGTEEFEDHLFYINDYHEAASYLKRMINHSGARTDHPYIASMFASYSKLLYEWNRLEEAEANINRIVRLDNKSLMPRMAFPVYITAARIQIGLGKPTKAQELMEQLKLQLDSPDYELFMRKIEAEEAWQFVHQGHIEYGIKWLQRNEMAHTDEVSLHSVFEYLALANVLAACGHREQALALSEKLLQLLMKADRLRDRIKVLILQSVLLQTMSQKEKALLRLESALQLAQPEGFIRSFVDEGAVMAELLTEYVQADSSSSASIEYAESLLPIFPDLQPLTQEDTRVQVRTFGRFQFMGRSGEEEIKWRTSKVEELIAYLVHHRGEPVDRDKILDSLWGDVDASRAKGLFNTTVYYLRKNLSAIGIEGIVQHVRGFYRIQMNRFDCDIDAFDQLISDGIPIGSTNIKQYEEQLEKLYQTGYLEGNDYPWAEQKRIDLESAYTGMLLQIYEHYVQERELSAAVHLLKKILACNPLNEDIHEKLIHVYLLEGDRVSAIKQYEHLEHLLQTELEVEPKASVKQLLRLK